MKLSADRGESLVRWRHKAGHRDGDRWITDDAEGERTGPMGRMHITSEDGMTWCGREVPQGARISESSELMHACQACVRILVGPWI